MVRRHAIGLEQHLIVDLAGVARHRAAQLVGELDRTGERHLESDHVRLARGGAPRAVAGIEIAAMAVVAGVLLLGELLHAHLVEALRGAEAAIGLAAVEEDSGVVAIELAALALAIRGKWPSDIGAFIPLQADPAQGA